MKRICVLLLLVAPLFGQDPSSKRVELEAGRGANLTLPTPVARARYHIRSTFPVTVFFADKSDLKKIKLSDSLSSLGDCYVAHVREADIWCDQSFSQLVIVDSRDEGKHGTPNVVTVTQSGFGPALPKF